MPALIYDIADAYIDRGHGRRSAFRILGDHDIGFFLRVIVFHKDKGTVGPRNVFRVCFGHIHHFLDDGGHFCSVSRTHFLYCRIVGIHRADRCGKLLCDLCRNGPGSGIVNIQGHFPDVPGIQTSRGGGLHRIYHKLGSRFHTFGSFGHKDLLDGKTALYRGVPEFLVVLLEIVEHLGGLVIEVPFFQFFPKITFTGSFCFPIGPEFVVKFGTVGRRDVRSHFQDTFPAPCSAAGDPGKEFGA